MPEYVNHIQQVQKCNLIHKNKYLNLQNRFVDDLKQIFRGHDIFLNFEKDIHMFRIVLRTRFRNIFFRICFRNQNIYLCFLNFKVKKSFKFC